MPRLPNINYYHSGHVMWRRCNRPGEEELPNDVVEAYYRQRDGDEAQGYAPVPGSFLITSIEPTMVSDHYRRGYLEWLEFASLGTAGKNWTSSFEIES